MTTLDQVRSVVNLFNQPTVILSVMSSASTSTEQIGRYLNEPELLAEVTDTPRFRCWVAVIPERSAQYCVDRLASGLHGAKAHDTIDAAVEHLADLVFA